MRVELLPRQKHTRFPWTNVTNDSKPFQDGGIGRERGQRPMVFSPGKRVLIEPCSSIELDRHSTGVGETRRVED